MYSVIAVLCRQEVWTGGVVAWVDEGMWILFVPQALQLRAPGHRTLKR